MIIPFYASVASSFSHSCSALDTTPEMNKAVWAVGFQPLTPEVVSAERQITELGALLPNWDGYGALPIAPETTANALLALQALASAVPLPEIVPNSNGTLSFEWESDRGVAHLEVGRTKISFYLKPAVARSVFCEGDAHDISSLSRLVGSVVKGYLFTSTHSVTETSSFGSDVHYTY